MAPTLTGPLGTSYQCKGTDPIWDASTSVHAISLPNYHPMLQWFIIGCCHLREIPGGAPAPTKVNKTSTHELIVADIDPAAYMFEPIDVTKIEIYPMSQPFIFNTQLDNLTDNESAMLVELLVADVLAGNLIPDPEYKKQWFEHTHKNQKWLSQK